VVLGKQSREAELVRQGKKKKERWCVQSSLRHCSTCECPTKTTLSWEKRYSEGGAELRL